MAEDGQQRIPSRVEHFSLERLDNEILLYHPGLTKAIHLNETAALVWELCDGQRSIAEIGTLLGEAFPEQADEVRNDVAAVVDRLSTEGALRISPAT
ncbi:MAG: PqqD family protein [Vicinamibacterales bacterium]